MSAKQNQKIYSLKNKKAALKKEIAKKDKYIAELEVNLRNALKTLKRSNEKMAEVRTLLQLDCSICLEEIKMAPKYGYLCKDHPLHLDCFVKYAYGNGKTPPETSCPVCRADYDSNTNIRALSDVYCHENLENEFDKPSPILPYTPPEIIEIQSDDDEEKPCAQDPYEDIFDFFQ